MDMLIRKCLVYVNCVYWNKECLMMCLCCVLSFVR